MLPEQQEQNYFKKRRVSNSLLGEVKRELLGLPALNNFSPALREGSIMHKLILERQNFNFRDYSGKERMKAMRLENALDAVCPPETLQGEKEVEYMYEYLGWKCKMKIDIVDPISGMVTDLKSTRCTTQEEFIGSIIDYDYWRQGAWYLDAPPIVELGINIFRIVAVCKVDPYPVFVFIVNRDADRLEDGRNDYKSILSYLDDDPRYQDYKVGKVILDDSPLDEPIYTGIASLNFLEETPKIIISSNEPFKS